MFVLVFAIKTESKLGRELSVFLEVEYFRDVFNIYLQKSPKF